MKRLPKFLKQYFWDVDFKSVDADKYRVDIIRRILNYGNQRAVVWMYKNFEKSEMKKALVNFRGYSLKSANYWSLILGVPKDEVLCLKKRLSNQPRIIWPY